jgi:hypothetical protein
MITQAAFTFTEPSPAQVDDLERLLNHLSNNPGFHTAARLSNALDMSDRKIRQLAESSDGLIISGPGSPGYCHLYHCPTETLAHIADTLRSQARHMIARSIRIRRRAHNLIR